MQTSVKRLDSDRVELTVTVPADSVALTLSEAYSAVASRIRIPGFRSGKAPRQLIDSRVGRDAVLSDARETIVEDSYPLALDAERLRPIGPPEIGDLAELVDGEEFTFKATVELRPEFKLASTEGLAVTVPPTKASDREIDAQIGHTRERFASLEPVDRGAREGDFALVSFVGKVDGDDYPGNTVDKYLYETGRGMMPTEFDAALWGVTAGGTARSEFLIPDTSANPDFVGKTATFDIEVHEVKAKVLPELDDAFAAEVGGYETFDEFREDVRRRLEEAKGVAHKQEVERAARKALAERAEGDVPAAMIEHRSEQLSEEFFGALQQRGVTVEDYSAATGIDRERIDADIALRAESVLREELALEALARAAGLEVDEDEVDAEIAEMAGSEAGAAERMKERFRGAGMMPLIREQIVHRKSMAWLVENVVVTEAEPSDDGPAAKDAGE